MSFYSRKFHSLIPQTSPINWYIISNLIIFVLILSSSNNNLFDSCTKIRWEGKKLFISKKWVW